MSTLSERRESDPHIVDLANEALGGYAVCEAATPTYYVGRCGPTVSVRMLKDGIYRLMSLRVPCGEDPAAYVASTLANWRRKAA